MKLLSEKNVAKQQLERSTKTACAEYSLQWTVCIVQCTAVSVQCQCKMLSDSVQCVQCEFTKCSVNVQYVVGRG